MFDDWHVLELYFDTSKNHATLIGKYWIGIFYLNIISYINIRTFKLELLICLTTNLFLILNKIFNSALFLLLRFVILVVFAGDAFDTESDKFWFHFLIKFIIIMYLKHSRIIKNL